MSGSASSTFNSAQEHYNAGKALCQAGQYKSALIEFQEALRKTPDSPAVHFWIGKAQAGQGNTAEAISALQRSAHLDPPNAKPHLEMGRAYVAADQLGAAIASFRQAQRLSPQSAEPLRGIARVLILQCQYDAALDDLQRALPLEPEAALTHVLLGRVYELKGMAKQADQAYGMAERLDPRVYAQAQVANGAQLEAAGRLGDAIKQYRHATQTDPTFLEAFLRLGGACSADHRSLDAVDAFRSATRIDPQSYIAHFLLGYVLLDRSQVNLKMVLLRAKVAPSEECVRSLRRAVELGPSEAAARYALAKAYRALGVHHLAREQFEQALTLDPNGEDAASARETLRQL